MKKLQRVLLAALLIGGGYVAYEYYRFGYFDMPKIPEGSFPLTFAPEFRAIMVGLEDVRPERTYIVKPASVPDWLTKAWTFCEEIAQEDIPVLEKLLTLGQQLEAICVLDVDGEEVVTGIIVSRPNL